MLSLKLSLTVFLLLTSINSFAQHRKPPTGGKPAVVVDEALSALRETPDLRGKLIRRLGRGRLVAIRSLKTSRDGIVFCLVNVTNRTHGWIQREALVAGWRVGDDVRLLTLVERSADFDRIVRARIFLNTFVRSPLRPAVLLLIGDAAEEASEKLTRDAGRRAGPGAPLRSYFLNYSGLDRYNRQGIGFIFDEKTKRLHYDGAAWRELVSRHRSSKEASQVRARLANLTEQAQ
jgi:hypothetical protein